MNESRRVTLHLPAGTVRNLDRAATAARRSRSNAAAVLLDSALAGKRRLAELARLASESTAAAAREAAADHLDRHAELSGIPSDSPEAA
jgi:predicted transcriptional regulator